MFSMALFYDVGDKVRMEMDREARAWGRKGPPDGTIGEVIAFHYYRDFVPRYGIGARHGAGVYEVRGPVVVRWPDGTEENQSDDIKPVDAAKHAARYQKEWVEPMRNGTDMNAVEARLTQRVRIGDLRETLLYEGDKARVHVFGEDQIVTVHSIRYHHFGQLRDDGSDMGGYIVDLPQGGSTWLDETRFTPDSIVKRGNVWRHYHGEPLVFSSIAEEAAFWDRLGEAEEISNPLYPSENKGRFLYRWSGTEALAAIREGRADCMNISSMALPFVGRMQPQVVVRRFKNREVGERIRAATLEGFAGVDTLPELS